MKTREILLPILFLVIGGAATFFSFRKEILRLLPASLPERKVTSLFAMRIESPAFKDWGLIPGRYTCDGKDVNPPLIIFNVPENSKSFVLIVDDPDAPFETFSHWLLWNISPDVRVIEENSLPQGAVEGTNDFGKIGYGGPCPPAGSHRYFFKLYAVDVILSAKRGTNRQDLEKEIQGHILEQANLIGIYRRQ